MPAKKHAHLVGLCGAGMRSLMHYLLAQGWTVSGSDRSIREQDRSEWARSGVQAFAGHDETNLPEQTTMLIYSLAIPEENPERKRAVMRSIPTFSYVEYLGELFRLHRGIGVAGTHGKTTTTAILAHLLRFAGREPSLVYGGRFQKESEYGWYGQSDLLIAECCEFRQSFLNYSPEMAVLLEVEADHFDCYPDRDSLLDAFARFCEKVNPHGLLVINSDCELTRLASHSARCRTVPFSLDINSNKNGTWRLKSASTIKTGMQFCVESVSGDRYSFEIPLFGFHQIANALAAIITASELGVEFEIISRALKSFPGIERRFEIRGEYRGWLFIDDYAHHPTEIEATIAAARLRYRDSRLTVAFQPHQILRTESLIDRFAQALAGADRVIVLPIYAAREVRNSKVESVARELVRKGNSLPERAESKNRNFEYAASLDHLRSSLDDSPIVEGSTSQNLFLTLGAGNIDWIYHDLPGFIR